MAENKPEAGADAKADPELDALLDSAAKDFQKPSSSDEPTGITFENLDPSMFLKEDGVTFDEEKWNKFEAEQQKRTAELVQLAEKDLEMSGLQKDFLSNLQGGLASGLPEELMSSLQDGFAQAAAAEGFSPEDISDRLKNLKLFGPSEGFDPSKEKEFTEAVEVAMQRLRENLSDSFPVLQPGEGEEGEPGNVEGELESLGAAMQHMMRSLLSKEMLLPSFKEMSEKFPPWLEENKSKLSEVDIKRYTEQIVVVKKIVEELENEGSEADKAHFDRMVELMQKMQDLGQPPKELNLGNCLDDSKIESLMQNRECSIM